MSGRKKEEHLLPPVRLSLSSAAKRRERSGVLYPTPNVRSVPHANTHMHALLEKVGRGGMEGDLSGVVEYGRPGLAEEWIIWPP